MSDKSQNIPLGDIPTLLQRGGEFVEETRYARDANASFVPWGKGSFKPLEKAKAPQDEEPVADEADAAAPDEAQAEIGSGAPAQAPAQAKPQAPRGAPATAPPLAPSPPPTPAAPAPSPEEIIAAIEKAREDGRALGYQQGIDAAKRETGQALATIRALEKELTMLTDDALQRNADIMAQHVRRIAQDLFGAVFAQMPDVFVERIKRAADMFTKAGGEFTLALNPHDLMSLNELIAAEGQIFEKIRITEDDRLQPGSFRLFSRDLDYEDAPLLTDTKA